MSKTTYRWERRKARQTRTVITKQRGELIVYQVILLIVVFFVWVMGARLLPIYAVTSSPCAEMAADFGAGYFGKSVFTLFNYISLLLIGFWLTLSVVYWKGLRTVKGAAFHLSLIAMIGLLALNSLLFHIPNNHPPDGVLAVAMVKYDPASERFMPHKNMQPKWGKWTMAPSDMSDLKECVWLERGLITYNAHRSRDPQPGTLSSQQTVKDSQHYRALTNSERARFLAKQACLKAGPAQLSDCEYGWLFNNLYMYGEKDSAFVPEYPERPPPGTDFRGRW